jgi:pimeloyl-ACP methyl ester carboxylesterase
MIWHESGGAGARTVLFLHGAGATAAVWHGVIGALNERVTARWVAADLSGHGGSDWRALYGVGQLAAEVAEVVREAPALLVVGHSLGAYVALALASGWFGVRVQGVLGIGPKIRWSDAELAGTLELAARPMRWYPSAEEAWARYRRVSGVGTDIAPGEAALARGVVHAASGWRLAQDPRTFAAAGASFGALAASAAPAKLLLARGARDPMVSLEELGRYAACACDIDGSGHNAHIEDPRSVIALLERLQRAIDAP